MSKITRRNLLTATGAATGAALGHNLLYPNNATAGYLVAQAGPETTKARIGFIALTDCAPVIIAKEKGYFSKYGMPNVEVVKQASWAVTRDNLELGSGSGGIDGAHILTPMPYQMTLGRITKGNRPIPINILARLNTNAQGITVANAYRNLNLDRNSSKLKAAATAAAAKNDKLKVAMTFPGGTHDLWIRYWLASGGIDPDQDVNLTVIPPPQMVANLEQGNIDGYCVGEPWNSRAVNENLGFVAATDLDIWPGHPEKVLGVREDWSLKYPKTHLAMVKALIEACEYCDDRRNREDIVQLLAKPEYIGTDPAHIRPIQYQEVILDQPVTPAPTTV
jgi:nitrate/nitrite transport system substrate-binding protein